MKPRVLVTETLAEPAIDALNDQDIDADVRTDLSPDELLEIIGNYDGLIVRSATKVTAAVIEAGDKLKVIGRAGIGVDNVDVDAATRRGVLVVNTPQGNIVSTAEHTVGLLLALAKRIPQAHASLTAGRWEKSKFMGVELYDKTLGIIGLGRVGTLVAQRCHALGMRIIACDPILSPQRFARAGVEPVELDELLARSDVISVHVTMIPGNRHMIGTEELGRCKAGVLILNASRGGVIDEDALAAAIKAGRIGGAALDVFEKEPVTSSPLFGLPDVVVTPHIAGQTTEAQDKASTIVAEQVILALRGEFVPNAVNVAAELPDSIKGFIPLAERLGKLATALVRGARRIEVEYRGRIADEDTRVLTLAVLRNFLQPGVLEPVTYVNASVIAAERGLDVEERKSSSTSDYLNLIRVAAFGDQEVTVAGTLMGPRMQQRLVEIDGTSIELTFTPYMAFFRYDDRPGVVHAMSGVLARHGINIATMQIGRSAPGAEAIMGLSVDTEIPQDVFDETLKEAGIPHGKFVVLA